MPDSKRFLPPDLVQRLGRLELRARHVVEGFLSGMHRSPYFGQSVEFVQHREYSWGDDPRRIDWKVWAKHNRYYIKQYEEETNLRLTLVMDVSKSMLYGQAPWNKFECAATLAACLAYLTLRQRDSVALWSLDEKATLLAPEHSHRHQLENICQALTQVQAVHATEFERVLLELAERLPRRGVVVLLSDLLAPRAGLFTGLNLLRQRGHDVMVMHVMHDDELDFTFQGPTRFLGLELPFQLACNPRALRDGYLQSVNRFMEEVRRGCAQSRVDYTLCRTKQPLDVALANFLADRLGTHHRAAVLTSAHGELAAQPDDVILPDTVAGLASNLESPSAAAQRPVPPESSATPRMR